MKVGIPSQRLILRPSPRLLQSQPRRRYGSCREIFDAFHEDVEEETLPFYNARRYYPVHIGDIYEARYKVIGKLGYGTYSTVWLCRELVNSKYHALKVSTMLASHPDLTHREHKIYEHLSTIKTTHQGCLQIRDVHDTFELKGPSGVHRCLLFPPMHLSVRAMIESWGNPLKLPLVKVVLKRLLWALDFLHTEANVVHTDLKTDNIMFSIEDKTMCERFEKDEMHEPSPCKRIDKSRAIYATRPMPMPQDKKWGMPMLCDFGEARIGGGHDKDIRAQPDHYRAPEVIFSMPWGAPVDTWNVGCLAWDLVEGKQLFNDIYIHGRIYEPWKHLARMVSLLGPPPPEFVPRSETTDQCFDNDGNWIADAEAKVEPTRLEDLCMRLEGDDSEQFCSFLRCTLKWLPEKRATARELLKHPWLQERESDWKR